MVLLSLKIRLPASVSDKVWPGVVNKGFVSSSSSIFIPKLFSNLDPLSMTSVVAASGGTVMVSVNS